jgi:intracellular sulfur oxidation DsrE/DsrF family protein
MKKLLLSLAAVCAVVLSLAPAVRAQQPAATATGKTHRVVFAVTSGEEADWNMTMGNLRNLITGLKPDAYEIEVVAYGPGILMVKSDSTVGKEIAALQEQGVRFVACQNAMRMRHLEVKDLVTGVTPVPAGIVEVVTKQEQGWIYIHAGR